MQYVNKYKGRIALLCDLNRYTDTFLESNKYSETGIQRFKKTSFDFQETLNEKSIEFAKAHKDKDMPLEVTCDHVRLAIQKIYNEKTNKSLPPGIIVCNVFEYILTGAAGIGGGNLTTSWGVILLSICAPLVVLLIIIRLVIMR